MGYKSKINKTLQDLITKKGTKLLYLIFGKFRTVFRCISENLLEY